MNRYEWIVFGFSFLIVLFLQYNTNKKINIIHSYVSQLKTIKHLRSKIRTTGNFVIISNSLNNTELIAMLKNTISNFIMLVDTIAETPIHKIKIKDIEEDIRAMAKNMQHSTAWINIDTKFEVEPEKSYKQRLKNEVVLPNMSIFTQRFKEEILDDEKKYNGTFSKICLGFISTILSESIRIYRECKIPNL